MASKTYFCSVLVLISLFMWGCGDDPKAPLTPWSLSTPVTGPTSVVSDVLNSWPAPSQVTHMAPPTFIYYGTILSYPNLEVAPGAFRRVSFMFTGAGPSDVFTLHSFSIYIENVRTVPVVQHNPPLTLIEGLGAGMLMSDVEAVLGSPTERSDGGTVANWTYVLQGMTCHVDSAPDVDGVWRVFNLEFEYE